jgi:hypothetical protein
MPWLEAERPCRGMGLIGALATLLPKQLGREGLSDGRPGSPARWYDILLLRLLRPPDDSALR